MNERRKQPDVTRSKILGAAGLELAERGYEGAAMSDIAERAGLTKGALFHHFSDKLGLVVDWVEGPLRQRIVEDLCEPLVAVESFPQWKEVCIASLRSLMPGHPAAVFTLLTSEMGADPRMKAALGRNLEIWTSAHQQALSQGQEQGWIHRSIRPDTEARFMVAQTCGWSAVLRLDERQLPAATTALAGYLDTLRPAGN